MKNILYIFFFILTTFSVEAQCPDSEKLKFGGTFGTRPDCYDPKTSTIQYFSYDMDTAYYCCHINKIEKYANFIEKKAENYIKKRAGEAFFNKLVFDQLMVIYHDYSVLPNFDSLKYDLDNCGRINYWLTYRYFKDSTITYLFGIEYDSYGKRVSAHMFPNILNNPKFMDIIELCDALEIQRQQKIVQFDSIKSIELNYDNEINSFIWLIKEDFPDTEGFHESDILLINANTGSLYKTDKEYWGIQY